MKKVLIIGGGLAGCCAAHLLSLKKEFDITLIEKNSYLGGGCKTHFYGNHPYTYGQRHFLTKEKKLFDFLNRYVPMRKIPEHEFLTYVEQDPGFYNFPIHQDDVNRMPDSKKISKELENRGNIQSPSNLEEYWINSVGPTLYNKFINPYTKKMWRIDSNTELDTYDWSVKGTAFETKSKAAWTEAISAFPLKINGYDDYFDIATRNTNIHLNTNIEEYDIKKYRIKVNGKWRTYDIIVSTISPETIFNNEFGQLRWIGREFFKIVLPIKEVFPKNVYFLYYANNEPFTRIVEYKKFYRYESPTTLLILEIPSTKNKLYPMPTRKDQKIAQKYFNELPENVYSIGRAGSYRYSNDMDDIIQQCMDLANKI